MYVCVCVFVSVYLVRFWCVCGCLSAAGTGQLLRVEGKLGGNKARALT